MPVEIRELVIKAVITENESARGSNQPQEYTLQNQQQLVQECVAQVLKIIKQSQNR